MRKLIIIGLSLSLLATSHDADAGGKEVVQFVRNNAKQLAVCGGILAALVGSSAYVYHPQYEAYHKHEQKASITDEDTGISFVAIPEKFSINKNYFSKKPSFVISDGSSNYGTLEYNEDSNIISFESTDKKIIATALIKQDGKNPIVEVYNSKNEMVGWFEESYRTTDHETYSVYTLYNSDGDKVGETNDENKAESRLKINNKLGNEVASLRRAPFMRPGKGWNTTLSSKNLVETKNIDPLIITMLGGYKASIGSLMKK
jgi:hypothetical protein